MNHARLAPRTHVVVVPTIIDSDSTLCPSAGAGRSPAGHLLIEGDNALVLPVIAAHIGLCDVVYLDPPYNTGKTGWVYEDAHEDWVGFMRERLLLIRGMLSDKGAVAVSIGHQRVHHLALLLAELFPDRRVHTITVEVSGGVSGGGVTQLAEYLLLVLPDGYETYPMGWNAGESRQPWEGLTLSTAEKGRYPNQVYPVLVDDKTRRVLDVGPSMQDLLDAGDRLDPAAYPFIQELAAVPGTSVLWPVTSRGKECCWRLSRQAFVAALDRGHVKVDPTRMPGNPNAFSVKYLPSGAAARVEAGEIPTLGRDEAGALILASAPPRNADIPTMWARKEHHTAKGTARLTELVGEHRFPYPKAVALVRDILTALTAGRPDAVILDPFAGSGTTFEAVAELNAADGGYRRAILVTNSEGDVFEQVTVPRVAAVAAHHNIPAPGSVGVTRYLSAYDARST